MDEPKWTGDLEDDCTLVEGDLTAHVEAMDYNVWYCSLYDTNNKKYLFHSSDANVIFLTGESARNMCELLIAAKKAGITSKFEYKGDYLY